MMNKVRSKQTGIITLLLSVVGIWMTGCNQIESSLFEEDTLLRFRCDSVATRASGWEQAGTNAITTMGVYAAHTDADWNGSSPLNFMQNRKVERANVASPWLYSPEAYWPGSGKTTFFAYAPYNASGLTLDDANGGVPQMAFTVADTHSEQVDLLTAVSLKNLTKSSPGGYASFLLRHVLTRINFAAKISAATPEEIKVTQLTISHLHRQGASSMNAANRQWTPSGEATATYTLSSVNGGGLNEQPLTTDYEMITATDGNLFLLPQTLSDEASLEISYTKDGTEATPITIKLADILAKWQPGEALRFLINIVTIDPTKPFDVELSYTFIPWDNHSTDVEINQDPFLYVTDVTTSSYDAAVTRVYFYTNEPREKVFIDPIGRVASLTGATIDVKNEFHALASDDPDGTANFHFDGNTHQGWIDLINRNTTTAGIKQPLLLKLCAGKLERHITVQPIISTEVASRNATRYIGTFHRHRERGERIVTWHMDEKISWTATVDNTVGDHEELVIDRMASPDYSNNLLYSLIPREAEGANVESNQVVSGKGRVYFRVGWKSTSLSANRYARINVKYSGTSTPPNDYIYCRQGEETDYLLESSTANDFTVYNLAGDGIFVDYPTQGGFLSQWGRPRLWPLIGENTPTGYPTTENTEDLDPDVKICPERFAYLNPSSITAIKEVLNNQQLKSNWGYYADGFFDRRAITDNRVDNASIHVASAGILLSVSENLHSFFVPTAGYRDETGKLMGAGSIGGYWAGYQDTENNKNAIAIQVFNGFTANHIKEYDKRHSFFLRCIRIPNAVVLYFDANGGDNAPRSVSAAPNESVRIPSKNPNDYWKDNYVFEGWNTQKDGGGTDHAPGSNFQMGTTDQILYAKWTPDYYKVNFKSYMSEEYLTSSSYSGYTIGNNGSQLINESYFQSAQNSGLAEVAEIEKAYNHLEFHKTLQSAATWSDAYNLCKNLEGSSQGWRLPRTLELMLVANHENQNIRDAIIGNQFLWTGTERKNNPTNAYTVGIGWAILASARLKTTNAQFRCVRELK